MYIILSFKGGIIMEDDGNEKYKLKKVKGS